MHSKESFSETIIVHLSHSSISCKVNVEAFYINYTGDTCMHIPYLTYCEWICVLWHIVNGCGVKQRLTGGGWIIEACVCVCVWWNINIKTKRRYKNVNSEAKIHDFITRTLSISSFSSLTYEYTVIRTYTHTC